MPGGRVAAGAAGSWSCPPSLPGPRRRGDRTVRLPGRESLPADAHPDEVSTVILVTHEPGWRLLRPRGDRAPPARDVATAAASMVRLGVHSTLGSGRELSRTRVAATGRPRRRAAPAGPGRYPLAPGRRPYVGVARHRGGDHAVCVADVESSPVVAAPQARPFPRRDDRPGRHRRRRTRSPPPCRGSRAHQGPGSSTRRRLSRTARVPTDSGR